MNQLRHIPELLLFKRLLWFGVGLSVPILVAVKLFGFDRELALTLMQTLIGGTALFSLSLAAKKYISAKETERRSAVLDQIDRFKKVLLYQYKWMDLVQVKKGGGFIPLRLPLHTTKLSELRKSYPKEFQSQLEVSSDKAVVNIETDALNELEYIATSILLYDTIDNEGLSSIKTPFVLCIEYFASTLIFHRNISTGELTYRNSIEVYNHWVDQVDCRTPEERVQNLKEEGVF